MRMQTPKRKEQMNINKLPLVSIIVPVYNVEKYIETCLKSLINQSFQNLEIILVDDGSTDRSKDICDLYAERDFRIQVIHKENEGVVQARICGFHKSTGDYITFVDSDDYIHTEYIERLLYAALHYEVDVVGCQYYNYNMHNKVSTKSIIRPQPGFYDKEKITTLLKNDFIYNRETKIAGMNPFLWTKLVKRMFVNELLNTGKNLWYEEDLVGILKLLYLINSMYILPEYLYYYVCHQGQVTKTFKPQLWENFVLCWEKINEIDHEGYLTNQFPQRALNSIFDILKKGSVNSYSCFKENFEKIRSSEIVIRLLKEMNYDSLQMKEKIKYILLKHGFVLETFLYFKVLKIKTIIVQKEFI